MEQTFGILLRQLRIRDRYTALKFAEKTGIHPVILTRIESGSIPPSEKDLSPILSALTVSKSETTQLKNLAQEKAPNSMSAIPPGQVPRNAQGYIALRVARDLNFSDKEWRTFYHKLPDVSKKEGV